MPSHKHQYNSGVLQWCNGKNVLASGRNIINYQRATGTAIDGPAYSDQFANFDYYHYTITNGSSTSHNHSFTGTQATINHMNPYLVAYCFKRIS